MIASESLFTIPACEILSVEARNDRAKPEAQKGPEASDDRGSGPFGRADKI